ncbi:MAG: amidohydrolase family protein, partial [Lachnospiraceae bacterium]|nr:amidohydrolase family protein [Lachnospiraceae bacterium]
IRMFFKLMPDKMCVISDSMEAAGLPDGKYMLGGMDVDVKNGKATLADGTIAGSTADMFSEIKNLIKFGIPKETAVLASTYTPALSIGMEEETGSIKEGKSADILLVDKDWNLEFTMVSGHRI